MRKTKIRTKEEIEQQKYRKAVVNSISESSHKHVQKHGVPLLLSVFIPGFGQLVKGEVKKGLLIFFAPSIVFIFIFLFSLLGDNSNMFAALGQFWLGGIILYFWQLYDAYNT